MLKILLVWVITVSLCSVWAVWLPHAHLFLRPAHTQACLPPMGLCIVKTEGPKSCGRRLEEYLPSGRENVISWDQRIRGRFLFFPFALSLSLHRLLTHAGTLTFSHPLLSCTYTHTHTLLQMEKNDTFSFSYFLCFYILGPGVQEATLCFHVTKHTEVCVDFQRRE